MNAPFDATQLDSLKFGIGQPVPRNEDPTLLQGQGAEPAKAAPAKTKAERIAAN